MVSSFPEVTIVILNWNGRSWLEQFLPSVFASTYAAFRVLVVDNGSTDDSVSWMQTEYGDRLNILELGENLGFAEGNNRALPHIDTPFFVLLNSDVEVSPGWLEPLVEGMQKDGTVAAIQPKICWWNKRESFEYAGAAGGWIDKYGYAFCRGRIFDALETDTGQYDDSQDCFWATGACMMLRRSVVKEIGLFHGALFAHWEEIDFCWRAWNSGYKVRVAPASVVYHVGGGTLPQGNSRKTFLNVRNSLICLFLNLPASKRFQVLLTRLTLDGVWAARSFLSGRISDIGAIIRGHWAFFGAMKYWRKRRREIYPKPVQSMPAGGYWDQSIVWHYFVRGKKRFSDLMKDTGG